MPSDPYQITVSGDNEISITLSDIGVATPATHASTHVTGGSDPIRLATNALSGLASATHITTLESHTTSIATNTSDISDILTTIGGLDSGILSLSVTAPITKSGTTNPTIGLPASSATVDGYMTAAQFQKLASVASGATANSIAVSSPLTTITSGGIQTLGVQAATTTLNGYLSSSDKTKLDSVTSGAAVSTVSVAAPLVKTGTTAPTISLPAATTSVNGYMLASDKSKLDSLTASTATTSALGYMSAADKTKLDGVTAGASITTITVSSPLVKTGTTAPALSIQAATTSQNGYLSSTDKTKLDSLTAVAPQVTKTFYSGPISGANANPTFRTIATTDLPTVAIAQGGTGATTAPLAVNALGFKYGRATVTAGSVAVADTAITSSSIIVATQEFMGTSSEPVGTSADLVIEWCTKNALGETIVAARELVKNSGSQYYAVDPYDAGGTFSQSNFIALFRSPTKNATTGALSNLGYNFTDAAIVKSYSQGFNYDVEVLYDLSPCTGTIGGLVTVPSASNTWGIGMGGSIILETSTNLKIILVREPNTSVWGLAPNTGGTVLFTDQPVDRCYWTPHGFTPTNTSATVSAINYPPAVEPQSIYINGILTPILFPRLRLASDVLVNNTPSTLNRLSVAKTAGTGFTIYSSNTVDTHYVDYVSYTP